MTPEQRDPAHRGRRREDQIFDGWTWARLIKIATALTLVGGIVTAIVSFAAATIVTRPELNAVAEKVDTMRTQTDVRFRRIETRQDEAEGVHQLLVPMARLQCLDLQRQRSASLALAAGLPCDSLLRRLR